jgi:hypothetical protein
VITVAGCGGGMSENEAESPGTGTTTTATSTATEPADPFDGTGTTMAVGPTTADAIALLERVAVGRHEGYDRVVFQFREGVPGYRIEYVEPPLKEDGSGDVVEVRGNSFVTVRMEPASGFDLNTNEGVIVYKGPKRLPGASVVQEVVRTGDFEAVLTWAVGLSNRVEFRVTTTKSPARLIVDFRNR